jgi:hypothetical protein
MMTRVTSPWAQDDWLPERYALVREVGSGGMGVVYEAMDGERRVAIKTLRHVDAEAIYRLKAEFRSLQDISHPNLIQLRELVESGGRWFLTMEFVDGVDFLGYVQGDRAGAPYDEARLRGGLRQLAAGLAALHAAGKVHRDVKPGNVLVTRDGRVVLLDLGLVADTSDRTGSGTIVGTAIYMAPEQAASAQRHPAGDWYAVGVMLYEALTGRLPFDGEPLRILMAKQSSEPPPPSAIAPGVPRDLDELCVRLLHTDPEARPSGAEILRRLGAPAPAFAVGSRPSGSGSALFVGRGRELDRLGRAGDRANQAAAVVSLVGESGVGKSALVAEFLRQRRAVEPGLIALTGRCYEREQIPYKALDGVLDELATVVGSLPRADADRLVPDDAALLCRLFPVLRRARCMAEAPLPGRDIVDPHVVRQRSVAALRTLLARLGAHGNVVLAIDDLQWADPDSFELLAALLAAPGTPRMLVLLGSREPLARLAPDLDALPGAEHLEIGRLDPDAANQLARRLLAQQTTAATTARINTIAAEAAGHPMFIAELVRHDVTASGEPVPRPKTAPPVHAHSSLDDVIRQRVGSLSVSAQHIMALLALADTPRAVEALRFASDLDPDTLARELALLRVASLARSSSRRGAGFLEPYHDRVRQAVQDGIDPDDVPALHRSIAMALETTGGENTDPHALVRHYQLAGDGARAAAQAERAARSARAALAFDRAIQMYRTALELEARRDPAERRALHRELAETLAIAGRGAEAADEFLRAADGADRAARLHATTQACLHLLMSGHVQRGDAVLAEVLADAGIEAPQSRAGAIAAIAWNRAVLSARGLRWKPRDLIRITPEQLLQLDILSSLALYGMIDAVRGSLFSSMNLRLALKVGEPRRIARAIAHEASYLCARHRKGQVKAWAMLEIARATIAGHETPIDLLSIGMLEAYVAFFEGKFRESLDRGHAVLRAMSEQATLYWEHSTLQLVMLFGYVRTGDLNGLRAMHDRALRDATLRRDRYLETTVRRYCQLVFLADDDPAAARRQLERATWVTDDRTFHVQHYFERVARLEIALYEGATDEARQVMDELWPRYRRSLLPQTQSLRTGMAWLRGRLELLAGSPDAAVGHARALEADDSVHSPVWAGLLRAGIAAATGHAASARAHLARVVDLATARDLELCAAVARWRLGEAGDDEARRRAAAWMEAQRVKSPERLVGLYAPGF